MVALKNPLDVNALNFDDPKEMQEFLSAWFAASIAASAPVMAKMHRDGIIDENGRRVSTSVPVVDAEASVEQQ